MDKDVVMTDGQKEFKEFLEDLRMEQQEQM